MGPGGPGGPGDPSYQCDHGGQSGWGDQGGLQCTGGPGGQP